MDTGARCIVPDFTNLSRVTRGGCPVTTLIQMPASSRFALEPLLPKKMHSRSQDKLDRDDPDKEKKDKKKEKRNSKHQEIFDKELKPADSSLQQSEAVILSETVI